MHPDSGFNNLEKMIDKYKTESFNEAETRAKIIDYILRECLGWDESNIRREDHVNTGFTDYQLTINNICRLVIEAKKTGEYFLIPESKKNRNYKIDSSIKTVTNLMVAIDQVRKYCIDIGCKYGAVFNGYQLVVFSAFIAGKPWTEGFCIVFHSWEDIKNNFNEFWNIFSCENIDSGSLISYLDIGKSEITFNKVIQELHNPDQSWARNELYTFIRPISDKVFSELLDETKTEVLKECYVFDRSNQELGAELQAYYEDKLPHFAQQYKIKELVERENKGGAFEKQYRKQLMTKEGSMLVLVGGIGCGKSTFLYRFFKQIMAAHENLFWFYVDFRNVSLDENLIENYVINEVDKQWTMKYHDSIKDKLDKCGFSISKTNLKEYLIKLFNILREMGFSLTLIIDNIDQNDLNFQEKTFLNANHLTSEFKTVTIIAEVVPISRTG